MEPLWTLPIIFAAGALSAFVAAMTGGAGLFTLSTMILLGIPPHVAIATNKLGAIGIFSGSLFRIRKENIIDRSLTLTLSLLGLLGGIFGALVLVSIDKSHVKPIAAVFIILVLVSTTLGRSLGIKEMEVSQKRRHIGTALFFLASTITGFFGPGMGILTVFIMMGCFGFTIITARANTLIPHLCMAASSLVVLAYSGFIAWIPGFALMAGMLLGGYWGAHHALKQGNAWVKRLFQVVIVITALKLLLT